MIEVLQHKLSRALLGAVLLGLIAYYGSASSAAEQFWFKSPSDVSQWSDIDLSDGILHWRIDPATIEMQALSGDSMQWKATIETGTRGETKQRVVCTSGTQYPSITSGSHFFAANCTPAK